MAQATKDYAQDIFKDISLVFATPDVLIVILQTIDDGDVQSSSFLGFSGLLRPVRGYSRPNYN